MASPAEQNARNVDERGTIATGESHTSERPKAAADSMYNAIEYNKYQVLSVSLGEVLQWIFAIEKNSPNQTPEELKHLIKFAIAWMAGCQREGASPFNEGWRLATLLAAKVQEAGQEDAGEYLEGLSGIIWKHCRERAQEVVFYSVEFVDAFFRRFGKRL